MSGDAFRRALMSRTAELVHVNSKITALFCDIGGVLLTNGWDRNSRASAAAKYQLDWDELERLHEPALAALETGQISLDEYLDRTVFYRPRNFTKDNFKEFVLAQSQPCPETLAVLQRLTQSGRYLIAALNNESRDLNLYRIERFGLGKLFAVFFSSCYLGIRKPDEAIYRFVLEITHRAPEESVFIDDREPNVDAARRLGMLAIHYQDPNQFQRELLRVGIEA